jgi:hypothetical protein
MGESHRSFAEERDADNYDWDWEFTVGLAGDQTWVEWSLEAEATMEGLEG